MYQIRFASRFVGFFEMLLKRDESLRKDPSILLDFYCLLLQLMWKNFGDAVFLMKQSRFEGLNGVMTIGFGKRFSRLRIKIFQFLRLTAEIYGCFTAFNPIKTLRFAFVGKNFIWREQLRTPKYCTQSKRNLEKGGISILTKEKACLIRKGLTMEL